MNPLAYQKLDVVGKTRRNILGWRGKFTPEFESASPANLLLSIP